MKRKVVFRKVREHFGEEPAAIQSLAIDPELQAARAELAARVRLKASRDEFEESSRKLLAALDGVMTHYVKPPF